MPEHSLALMEAAAPWLALWISFFSLATFARLLLQRLGKAPGLLFIEGSGLPLILMHSVCFVEALLHREGLGLLLFAWWGPGFLIVAWAYLRARKRGTYLRWGPWRPAISWACKINYLVFVALYLWQGHWTIIFVLSLWIMNDQVALAWRADDADRTRRTLDDAWIFRLLYPAGLFIPCFVPIPGADVMVLLSGLLLAAWLLGLLRIWRLGLFRRLPGDQMLLRNMTYFRDCPRASDT
ncbi:MAG: hypothetical protein RL095_44 [Verrucomicrobiota bacterium]|jgi:hypothetical protein